MQKKNPSEKIGMLVSIGKLGCQLAFGKFEGLVVGNPGHLRKCFISHPAVDEPSQLAFSSWKGELLQGINQSVSWAQLQGGHLPIANGVTTYNPYKWVTTYRGYKL